MASTVMTNMEDEQPISRTYQYRKVCTLSHFVYSFSDGKIISKDKNPENC